MQYTATQIRLSTDTTARGHWLTRMFCIQEAARQHTGDFMAHCHVYWNKHRLPHKPKKIQRELWERLIYCVRKRRQNGSLEDNIAYCHAEQPCKRLIASGVQATVATFASNGAEYYRRNWTRLALSTMSQSLRPCWLSRVTAPRPVGPAPTTSTDTCVGATQVLE